MHSTTAFPRCAAFYSFYRLVADFGRGCLGWGFPCFYWIGQRVNRCEPPEAGDEEFPWVAHNQPQLFKTVESVESQTSQRVIMLFEMLFTGRKENVLRWFGELSGTSGVDVYVSLDTIIIPDQMPSIHAAGFRTSNLSCPRHQTIFSDRMVN